MSHTQSVVSLERAFSPAALAPAAPRADLMEATIAAYALMSHADGEPAGAERRSLFAVLRGNRATSGFSRRRIADVVAEHEANFRLDPEVAQQIAREKVAVLVGQQNWASLVVDICRAVVAADGIAHPAEYRQLAEIKALLGYIPDRFT